MRKYKVEMTRTNVVRVEFDEAFFNEEWFEGFRDFFYDYFTLDELAEYIIFNVIENNQRFIEGIGYPLFDGRNPYVREGQEKDINEHVNVIINIYDTDAEFEVEEVVE